MCNMGLFYIWAKLALIWAEIKDIVDANSKYRWHATSKQSVYY